MNSQDVLVDNPDKGIKVSALYTTDLMFLSMYAGIVSNIAS